MFPFSVWLLRDYSKVSAFVDTREKSSVISCETFHTIVCSFLIQVEPFSIFSLSSEFLVHSMFVFRRIV